MWNMGVRSKLTTFKEKSGVHERSSVCVYIYVCVWSTYKIMHTFIYHYIYTSFHIFFFFWNTHQSLCCELVKVVFLCLYGPRGGEENVHQNNRVPRELPHTHSLLSPILPQYKVTLLKLASTLVRGLPPVNWNRKVQAGINNGHTRAWIVYRKHLLSYTPTYHGEL